jgi:CRISPR/Cas system-associated protein Csm6
MISSAMMVLGGSILGISLLFYVKHWETKNARVFVPGVRILVDEGALLLKAFLLKCQQECRKLGPTSIRIGRAILHDLALALAALSRASERQAHRLADMVSHKHAFQRRETKNDFLKHVGDIPMRNSRDVGVVETTKRKKRSKDAPLENEA